MRLDPKVATWLPPSLVTGWTESWNLRTHLWKSLPGSWRWLQGQEADGHDREVNRAQGLSLILSFPSVTEVRAGSQQKYILKSLIPSPINYAPRRALSGGRATVIRMKEYECMITGSQSYDIKAVRILYVMGPLQGRSGPFTLRLRMIRERRDGTNPLHSFPFSFRREWVGTGSDHPRNETHSRYELGLIRREKESISFSNLTPVPSS